MNEKVQFVHRKFKMAANMVAKGQNIVVNSLNFYIKTLVGL